MKKQKSNPQLRKNMIYLRKIFLLFSIFTVSSVVALAQETGGIKGKIRTSDGDGIGGASVTARQDGKNLKTATADEKGRFVLENLKPGIYNLVFEKEGYSSGVLFKVEIQRKKIRNLGDRLILNVDQGTLVIIRGSVFAENGRSIYGAKVKIEKILDDGSTKEIGDSVYTSQSGEFVFRQPDEKAKFRVTAYLKDASDSKEIEVDGAAIYRLSLILNPKESE